MKRSDEASQKKPPLLLCKETAQNRHLTMHLKGQIHDTRTQRITLQDVYGAQCLFIDRHRRGRKQLMMIYLNPSFTHITRNNKRVVKPSPPVQKQKQKHKKTQYSSTSLRQHSRTLWLSVSFVSLNMPWQCGHHYVTVEKRGEDDFGTWCGT